MESYFETDRSGSPELSKRFMADLCAHMGGTDLEHAFHGGRFKLGALNLYGRQGYGANAKRVTFACGAADTEAWNLARAAGRFPKFPEAKVDPDRGVEAVARDLTRRIITPAAEPLAKLRELADAQRDASVALRAHAARINATYPGAVTLPDRPESSASFYLNRGVYLTGRLNAGGGLYVDRLGTVPPEKLDALLRVLAD